MSLLKLLWFGDILRGKLDSNNDLPFFSGRTKMNKNKMRLKKIESYLCKDGCIPRKDSQQEHKKGVETRSKTWEE